MQYTVGQELFWVPDAKWGKPAPVTVTGLRNGGCAVLSNGWRVDEDGVAEGTGRVPGGRVMVQGIAAKIQRGEPLTAAQQAMKDGAQHGFRWPEPPNVEFSGVPAGHSSNHPAGGTSAGTQG